MLITSTPPLLPTAPITNAPLGLFTALLSLSTILGNLLTVLVILNSSSKAMRRPHITLICVLSFFDLLIGLLHVQFVAVACFTGRWLDLRGGLVESHDKQVLNNNPWCKVSSFVVQPLFKMAIATVAVIGVERTVTVRFPFKSAVWITNKRVIFAVFLAWLPMVGLLAQEVYSPHDTVYMMPAFQCVPSYASSHDVQLIILASMVVNGLYFLLITLTTVDTVNTVLELKRKAHTLNGEAKEASNKKMVLTVTFLILLCINTSTWLPQYLASMLRYLLGPSSLLYNTLAEYTFRTTVWWVQYLSPAVNPAIYALRLKVFRTEITRLVGRVLGSCSNPRNSVNVHVPMLNRTIVERLEESARRKSRV